MRQNIFLDTPIEYLKGVGPQRAELFRKELGISQFSDLVKHYPFRYIDRSKFFTVAELNEDLPLVQLKGTISRLQVHGGKRPGRMSAVFSDNTGQMDLVWFQGGRGIRDTIHPNRE